MIDREAQVRHFAKSLKDTVASGDIDTGVAEDFASIFGFSLATRARVVIQAEIELWVETMPGFNVADIGPSDFDVNVDASWPAEFTVEDVSDVSVEIMEYEIADND